MLRSGFHSTDVIEFRVNERRNFGDYLRKIKMEFPKIEAIDYFLVRDISTELVQSHADFRKMRRLEPKLWDRYLRELGTSAPERWIIFHWREGGIPGADVEDFIALAFFTKPRYHLLAYLAVIVLLGAAGSGIQALWTLFMNSTAIFCDDFFGLSLAHCISNVAYWCNIPCTHCELAISKGQNQNFLFEFGEVKRLEKCPKGE